MATQFRGCGFHCAAGDGDRLFAAQKRAQGAAPPLGRAPSLRAFRIHPNARRDAARPGDPGHDHRHARDAVRSGHRLLAVAVVADCDHCPDRLGGADRPQDRGELYLRRFRIDTEDNLLARKHVTQVRVLLRTADVLVVIVTIGAALMTFGPVRQYGVSLFASAGVAGIVAGLAARPVLSNLFAGVQLAMTQPIRIDDQVVIENEWGTIEEITSTYVVVRLWDWRRMIVPLTYFIEKPFQK